jgi:single-stranded-DNA-specific exonuclease
MARAVDIIIEAISRSDDILIWGDYDVDGITATSLLYLFFQQIGISVRCHIPDRLTEGYGLNDAVLRGYSRTLKPNKLLITVDCGISNGEELLLARKYGFKSIVTDHHQVSSAELYADATINPKRSDCSFPFSDLAGVGVAFYLAAGVRSKIQEKNILSVSSIPNLKPFLGLVAVGTIADIMPLNQVNRVLVKAGFEAISEGESDTLKGLEILLKMLDINPSCITSDSIAFKVAPAINAAGRLGKADQPLKLLVATETQAAQECAARLIQFNNRRKRITEECFDLASKFARKDVIRGVSCLVVLGEFHEGVLGIVASRLVERHRIPVLVCCYPPDDRTTIKGSGRAPAGWDLYRLIEGAADYLNNFGGHELAAGFSLCADNFLPFKRQLETLASCRGQNIYNDNDQLDSFLIELSLSDAFNRTLLDNLANLEPTGEGNQKPVFIDKHARFVSCATFGRDKAHLKGVVRGTYRNISVIGFNLAEKTGAIDLSEPCRIVYSHSLESYNGKTGWRVIVKNISQA